MDDYLPKAVGENFGFCLFKSGDMGEKYNIKNDLNSINSITVKFDELASI